MTDDEQDRIYDRGSRAAWTSMLAECLKHLGYQHTAAAHAAWVREREEAIAMLRQVCEEHGDNDWPEDLFLPDIIEKHLWRHLEE